MAAIAVTDQGEGSRLTNQEFAKLISGSVRLAEITIKRLTAAGVVVRKVEGRNRALSLSEGAFDPLSLPARERAPGGGKPASPPPTPDPEEPEAVEVPEPSAPVEEKPKTPPRRVNGQARNLTIDEHLARELPNWLPKEAWEQFVRYRHDEHGPFTERTATGVVNKVGRLRAEGHDPVKLLQVAEDRCWLTVFAQRGETEAANISRSKRVGRGLIMNGVAVR